MALPYNQIEAITNKLILKKVTAGVFTGNIMLNRLRAKQMLESGGDQIKAPLFTKDDTGTTGGFYSPRDTLSLNEYDGLSASLHEWRYLYESLVVYKADIAKNGGKAGVVKLLAAKAEQMERAFKQRLIKGVFSDGGASTGALDTNQFDGLQAIIADAGSYGSIAPADLATWVSYVDDNSGVNRALTQAILDKAFDQTVEGEERGATMGVMDKSVFTKFKGLLTPQQRTTRENSVSGQGHKGQEIVYNGIDYFIDNQMPSNTLFHVDERHFKLHVHQDHNMRRQKISDLETADAMLQRVFLYGNVVGSERNAHSRINDISV